MAGLWVTAAVDIGNNTYIANENARNKELQNKKSVGNE
jgi:hypothetical protein